jgi:ketosteroid isomerase-like protein
MNTSGENKKIVLEYLRLLSAGDVDGVMNLLSDDFEQWVPGNMPISGAHTKAIFREMLVGASGLFPNGLIVSPTSLISEGDLVAVEATGGGRTRDGRTYANTYHYLFETRNGKITRVREYMDTKHAYEIIFGG